VGRGGAGEKRFLNADKTEPGWRVALALRLLLLSLAYFGAARLGLLLASVHGSVSPVWPATGLAIWALSGRGTWLWPGVALGDCHEVPARQTRFGKATGR
jgi:MASE1